MLVKVTETIRNPHAGQPFSDDDAAIAAALADVSIPALLCSLVHMTGDPAWVRGPHQPRYATSVDFQGGMSEADCAERCGGWRSRPSRPFVTAAVFLMCSRRKCSQS